MHVIARPISLRAGKCAGNFSALVELRPYELAIPRVPAFSVPEVRILHQLSLT